MIGRAPPSNINCSSGLNINSDFFYSLSSNFELCFDVFKLDSLQKSESHFHVSFLMAIRFLEILFSFRLDFFRKLAHHSLEELFLYFQANILSTDAGQSHKNAEVDFSNLTLRVIILQIRVEQLCNGSGKDSLVHHQGNFFRYSFLICFRI